VNPIGPRGVYDEAKRYAEAMTMAYRNVHGVSTRIARFFNTYGPRMRLDDGRVVPNLVRQALRNEPMTIYGDGHQTRSFAYVDDVIEGVWRLAHADYTDPVNIGSEDERTVREFAETVRLVTESKSEIVFLPALPDDPRQRRPDLTRAREVLNWMPSTLLAEGLLKTLEYFRRECAGA
jgi:dTDP-glucose 4,6-dehydratase